VALVRIRPATRSDLRLLGTIEASGDRQFREHFGYDPGWGEPPSGEHRAAQPGFLLVGEDDGEVIGFVHVLEVDDAAHLEQVSVRSDRQQRGFGRALVEAAKDAAAQRGYAEITLMTYADVPWNAPFYVTCGFVQTEPTTRFQHRLLAVERDLGLGQHGRRVLMAASLSSTQVTDR
jgi:GNAT superfamily N-acetyltransferase